MSSSFKMAVVVIFMLLFIGYLSADIPAECGYATGSETEGCVRAKTSTGYEFAYNVHEELLIWSHPSHQQSWMYMCYTASESCKNEDGFMKEFVYVSFGEMIAGSAVARNTFIYKYSVSVMEQRFSPNYVLPIDVTVFNFPSFWYYYNNQENLIVALHPGNINTYSPRNGLRDGSYVYFTDKEDKCRAHRPPELKLDNLFTMDLYMNRKHARYSYFFIKKDSFICAYAFEHGDLFNNNRLWLPEAKPVKFHLIENYPTQNYAPNFFAIDPLYGTFVSLYWDGHSDPEAHFYAIDENNLNNIQLVDKLKLTHFHDGCLKAIFENNFGDFTKGYLPAFQSYGGQVFASHKFEINEFFPPKREKYIWNGLWKDEKKDFIVAERKIHKDPIGNGWKVERDRNVLFWAKKSWIQKDKPAIPYITSEPTTFSPKTTPVPTTLPPALPTTLAPTTAPATTEPPLSSTTVAPTTAPATALPPALPTTLTPSTLAPTTAPATTEPPKTTTNAPSRQTTSLASTTDSLNSSSIPITTTVTASNNSGATIDDANSTYPRSTPSINDTLQTKVAALVQDASDSSSDFGCFLSENLWILILIIGIDIFEIIIIILLVVLKFRGAKKLKEAMTKKNVQKSGKKNKTKQFSEAKKLMPKTKSSKKKKQKESTKEKSATKTEDTGKTTVSEAQKTTTVDQTNYYTVDQSFHKK